ncbi:GNAT family N-acetyltransferase [Lysinibacillus sphaericus]|uniref:Spermine/spermidine acetyltransferase n=1 Tax=Lysinibacillus sphaericus OT4b.31 TaxID=1285586 RepID=R7ZAY9_LYSSH|nr:GNAT family N-acetyltransferase [Lysinibacillus sphaericus]EON71292.1 spermine/spermidine acetyltransferase [Lysinibacillus sphaericus OT4b.31]
MFTEIRDITTLNKEEILALRIADHQQDFIETTMQCLTEAENDRRFIPVGLYKDDIAVGFAMYGIFPHEDKAQRVWLDRYFIDERFQHKGLGRYFLQQLIHFLVGNYQCQELFLSVYDNNKVAIQLYKKFGFIFNGELDEHGEKVMVKEVHNLDSN